MSLTVTQYALADSEDRPTLSIERPEDGAPTVVVIEWDKVRVRLVSDDPAWWVELSAMCETAATMQEQADGE